MAWSWQHPDWPHFQYDGQKITPLEAQFLKTSGICIGAYTHISEDEQTALKIELLSEEAIKTSEIEGELLDRVSVQVSLCRQFGLDSDRRRVSPSEQGIAAMMTNLFSTYEEPLTHQHLFHWHELLMHGRHDLEDMGAYRTSHEPTQVISGGLNNPKIHYEAPPSSVIAKEMQRFVAWFNETGPQGKKPLPMLVRASIAHLYFVLIHPFEDGNGRIARALAEKAISQGLGYPSLISLSYTIEKARKTYYELLEKNNKTCEITTWILYFSQTLIKAQENTYQRVEFIIQKQKLLAKLQGQLNARQKKVLLRMFAAGVEGFEGGLSASNYMAITQASTPTATRDLNDLVDKGALKKEGKLRYTRYYLNIST